MWALTNQTRFAAERAFVRDRDGAEVWLVAVRGTFVIREGGEVVLAEEQEPVAMVPAFFGVPGESCLRYESDLIRTKAGTDVILHATAHSPGGTPTTNMEVEVSVGSLSKNLRVIGDRVWQRSLLGLKPGTPTTFRTMPIVYERAFGGVVEKRRESSAAEYDDRNPLGVGLDAEEGAKLPNIEYPTDPLSKAGQKIRTAGFGAIPSNWEPRRRRAGTYDEAWQRERQPLVPRDFDDSFFNCVPDDQRTARPLRGGEEVLLRNLTTEGLLRFKLPRVSLGFSTRIAGSTTHHRADCHTVIIEPEEHRLIMVWHTSLPCHHTLYTLKETVVFEKERLPVAGQDEPEAELVI